VKQLLVEGVVLSALGAAGGLALGVAGIRGLIALSYQQIPGMDGASLNPTVLAFTIALALVTGVVFGLVPGIAVMRGNMNTQLKDDTVQAGTGAGGTGGHQVERGVVPRHVAVLPGHVVEINLATGDLRTRCYEDILTPPDPSSEELSPECVQRTKELIVQCCRESTISDTSYTTFCSGGLDSSLITAIVRPDVAYHCNYSDPECNETFFAQHNAPTDTWLRTKAGDAPARDLKLVGESINRPRSAP